MPWLFAAVVLVCAILFPRFRKVLLGIVVLLGLVGAAYYVWQSFEESASKRRIGLPEIELTDVQFRDNGFDGYTIIGRARNRSVRYTLSGLTIRTVLEDCLNETNCDVVFEHDERSSILFRVPPGKLGILRSTAFETTFVRKERFGGVIGCSRRMDKDKPVLGRDRSFGNACHATVPLHDSEPQKARRHALARLFRAATRRRPRGGGSC